MTEEEPNSEVISSEDETSLPESAEQSETQETEVENAEAEETEAPERPKKTAKDRIDELTRARREAEREREYWREQAMRTAQPAPQQQAAPEQTAPDPEQYDAGEFDTRYIKDLARWEAKQEVAQAMQSAQQQAHLSYVEAAYQDRVAKAAETLPDYEEKVILGAQRNEWACSPYMADAIKSSEKGPELAHNLASNPAEAARIARLSPALQFMEMGKLEATLSRPQAKTATTAPAPTPSVRGSGGKFAVQPDTNDFAAFEKQYGGS